MSKLREIQLGKTKTNFIDGDRSKRYPKREEFVDSGVLFLNAASINSGTIDKNQANRITEIKYSAIKKGRIQKNDILLTTRGNGVGDTAFVNIDEKGLINAQMLILRVDKSEICPKFLYYYLSSKTLYDYIWNFASGSAQPQIPIRDLKKIPIFLSDIFVQQKIAAILSAYDDLIENNKRRIALLENMAEEIYREWFVRFRFPGYQTAEFEKGIPKGWKIVKFTDMLKIQYGNNLATTNLIENAEYPVYGAGGVIGYYDKKNRSSRAALITCRGNGSGTVWRTEYSESYVTNNSFIIDGIEAYEGLEYFTIYEMLKHITIEEAIGGAAQPQITIDSLSKIKFLAPPRAIVESYSNEVKALDECRSNIMEQNKILTAIKDSLLPRLISGKLSVEDLDIQFPPSMQENSAA